MNYARIVLGGLVAGLVLNVGEFILNEVLLKEQMQEMFRRFNITPPSGSFIAVAVILTFALGVLLVMLYAMIRPRYGPGPKTAICAALVVWFVVGFYMNILYGVLFSMSTSLIVIGMVWCLVEYCLAALAGAWVYKEA
jgi:hypothetical protein